MDSDADSSRASSPDLVVDTSEEGFFSSQYQSFCQERGAAPSRMERGGGKSKNKAQTYHKKEGVQDLRLKVNSRERKRMHDLNQAMDGLREVMPYANGPSVRKLSKISTLLLARNYILMLSNSLEEMKKLVGDVYGGAGKQAPSAHRAPAAPPQLALHPLAQSLHALMGATSASVAPHSPPSAGYLGFRPPVHSLLKDPMHLGGSYGHYHGMLCPCSLCQPLSATVPSLHTVSGFSVGK